MSLRLYDTAARAVRDFTPLRAGQASVYVCGLTVQGRPHIGHVRAALAFDVLRRWLTHSGLDVTYVRNVTDIDDKILAKSAEHGVPWWAWAYDNELAATRALDVLGVLPPTYEPRATGHIPEMVELMQRLIDAGHAYAVDGDVYFDVRSFPEYGALTGQRLDDLQPAGDTDTDDRKRDPRDFALWKGHKEGEPETASWATPWGRGRPGWHLECSAMVGKYLGPEFDIHGGGLDLRFPHHENELAQSCAAGDGFARYWMHNGWVTLGGEKMSKSLGNTALVDEVVQAGAPGGAALLPRRAALPLDDRVHRRRAGRGGGRLPADRVVREARGREAWAAPWQTSRPATRSARRWTTTWARPPRSPPSTTPSATATPRSAEGDDAATGARARGGARHARRPRAWTRSTRSGPPAPTTRLAQATDGLVALALEQRQAARARKDFAAADAIRDQLTTLGVSVEDTPDGPRWELSR